MKKILFLIVSVVFAATLLNTPSAMAINFGKSKWPIEIEYVTFVGPNHVTIKLYKPIWDEITEKSNGKLKFVYRGGPEAIKIFAQAMAVYKGATDMVLTTPSFMGKLVKGTSMLTLAKTPISQHRKCGLYDYMNEVFNKKRMQFLQMYPRETGTAYVMLSKDNIQTLADFNGKSMRGGDYMDAVAPLLGMKTVSMRYSEEYTALERGLIDVGRMTIESMMSLRLYEVAKYLVQPPHGSTAMSWFMNLDKWNEIPRDMQQMILDTMYDRADEIVANFKAVIDKSYADMKAQGVQTIELEGKDREFMTKDVEKAMYDYFLKEDPVVGKRIYELTH